MESELRYTDPGHTRTVDVPASLRGRRRFRPAVPASRQRRRWRDGLIPDVNEAVESPLRLTEDPFLAQGVLDLVPHVPTPVWGRDELHAGEMWNSNSLISWLIARSGLDSDSIHPPAGGRAPGWDAGLVVARRPAHRNPRGRLQRTASPQPPCGKAAVRLGAASDAAAQPARESEGDPTRRS